MHSPFHPKGSGIVVLCTVLLFPLALLFVWLAADILTAEIVFCAFIASVVLGIVSALVLQSAVLDKLPYDRKKRIENICDILAFLLIPAAVIAGIVWLMCRHGCQRRQERTMRKKKYLYGAGLGFLLMEAGSMTVLYLQYRKILPRDDTVWFTLACPGGMVIGILLMMLLKTLLANRWQDKQRAERFVKRLDIAFLIAMLILSGVLIVLFSIRMNNHIGGRA